MEGDGAKAKKNQVCDRYYGAEKQVQIFKIHQGPLYICRLIRPYVRRFQISSLVSIPRNIVQLYFSIPRKILYFSVVSGPFPTVHLTDH
jgi:hypothetical protein